MQTSSGQRSIFPAARAQAGELIILARHCHAPSEAQIVGAMTTKSWSCYAPTFRAFGSRYHPHQRERNVLLRWSERGRQHGVCAHPCAQFATA